MPRLLPLLWFLSLAVGPSPAQAQGSRRAGEVVPPLPVLVEVEGRPRARLPQAAFRLAPAETLLPELPAVGWTAVLRCRVRPPSAGEWRLGVEATGGQVRLVLPDPARALAVPAGSVPARAWTGWRPAEADPLPLRLEFRRAGGAEARVRLLWEQRPLAGEGFRVAPEPVPGRALDAPADSPDDPALLLDRILLGRMGCANCHVPVRPETWEALSAFRAPDLGRAGERLRPDWLAAWLADPQGRKPGCGMPDLLGPVGGPLPPAGQEQLRDLVAFLRFPGGAPFPEGRHPDRSLDLEPATLALGRRFFHERGCVACHGPLAPAADAFGEEGLPGRLPDLPPPVPLDRLGDRWRLEGLASFLEEPRLAHPDGRMPSLGLTAREADLIANWLLAREEPPAPSAGTEPPDPEAVGRGRRLYAELGCGACHDHAPGHLVDLPPLEALPASWEQGCMDPDAAAAPRWGFVREPGGGPVGARLRRAIVFAGAASGAPAPLDRSLRTVTALGCLRCHTWNGAGGPPEAWRPWFRTTELADIGDEGRLPPDLGDAGFRLATAWMRQVLVEGARARPLMAATMPRFGVPILGLAEGLSALHGLPPDHDRRPPAATDELVRAGRELAGRSGMDCLSCHGFRDFPSLGAPPLDGFAGRLRYEWWRAYAPDPARYKPGTRMPRFLDADGRSPLTRILDGDGAAQVDALWAWFSLGPDAPPPEGLPEQERGLALEVGDRPRVIRAFLPEAGPRGLAVGFPAGLHFAWDAARVRLVRAWTDPFLDMRGSWTARGGAVLGGQGREVWRAPPGPTLLLRNPGEGWPEDTAAAGREFLGYRFLSDGTPVLRSRMPGQAGSVEVEEWVVPRPEPGVLFRRNFRVRGLAPGERIWVRCGSLPAAPRPLFLENSGLAARRTVPSAGAAGKKGTQTLICAVLPFASDKPMHFALEVPEP